MRDQNTRLFKSVSTLSSLTLASRVLGLVREAGFAHCFGPGAILDAYAVAFQIPNLFRRLFGEGALSASFIPVLSRRLEARGRDSARQLLGVVLVHLFITMVAIVLLIELGLWFAHEWHSSMVVPLTGVLLPYAILICLVATIAAAQHVIGRFSAAASMPILFNCLVILGVWFGSRLFPNNGIRHIYFVAVVVLFAGFIQLICLWSTLKRYSFSPILKAPWQDEDLKRIMLGMAPVVLGMAAVQINTLMDRVIVLLFVSEDGGVSSLFFAERLYQLPLGIFGAAIATAIFPMLSRLAHTSQPSRFEQLLSQGLQLALFLGVPSTLGLVYIRHDIIRLLFEHGQFDVIDVHRVSDAVWAYSLGISAYIGLHVMTRAYYSLQHHRLPALVAGCGVLLNVILNLVLVRSLQETGVAIATSISAIVQLTVLLICFPNVSAHSMQWSRIGKAVFQSSVAGTAMWFSLQYGDHVLADISTGRAGLLIRVSVLVPTGALVYLSSSWLIGAPSVKMLLSSPNDDEA